MGVSINTRQAYSEVDEFLGLISNEHRNKIPKKLREFFREEKDTNYIKGINPNVPIKNQKLKEETLGIIALLNLQYWCEDENEKKRLKEVYAKNEKRYQEYLQVQFNPNEIFKKKEPTQESLSIVEYKESIIKKLVNKIKIYFLDSEQKDGLL